MSTASPDPTPFSAERLLGALRECTEEVLAFFDPGDRIVFHNAAWSRTFSAGDTATEQLLRELTERVVVARATGQTTPFELRWTTLPHFRRSVRGRCIPVRTQDDALVSVLVVGQDITPLRNMQTTERLLAHALQRAREYFCLTDLENTILFVNSSFCSIYGYSEQELLGNRIDMVRPAREVTALAAMREAVLREDWHGEVINRRKDGTEFPVELWSSVVRDPSGEPVAFADLGRDISDRKQMEILLRASESRFRTLVENSPDGLTLLNSAFKPIYASAASERILGYTPAELLASNILDLIHPLDRPAVEELLARKLREPGVPILAQYRVRHKNGSWRWLESTSTNLLGRDDVGSIVVSYRDITDRLHAEKIQAAVYEIAQAPDQARTLDELYEAVHAIVATIMPANNFYIALYDIEEDVLSFPYFRDEVDEPSPPQKPGKGLTEYVLRTGKSLLCTPEVQAELERTGQAALVGVPSPIWLGVPLVVNDRPIGVMVVQHYEDPSAYGVGEQRVLEFVSSQVAKAIERKRVEEKLRTSEERYRNFVERSSEGIWRVEFRPPVPTVVEAERQLELFYRDSRLAECNAAMAQMLGFSDISVVSFSRLEDIFPQRDQSARELLRRFIASGYQLSDEEFVVTDHSGNKRHLQYNLLGTVDEGALVQIWGTQRDITAQMRGAELLRQSEEKFRTLFEESQDGIIISTPEGRVIDINQTGIEILGYTSKEEIYQTDIATDIYLNPEEREIFKQILARHGYVIDFEFTIKRQDGQQRIILETASALRNDEGEIISYRGFIRDITERKMLEDQLRQAQKMEGIGTLAGGIAHDFNNLLGIILGYTTLLEAGNLDPKKYQQSLDVIKRAVERGANLVRQLLTFARKADPSFKSVHLHETITELSKMLKQTFPKTIAITTKLDEHLPSVVADSTQIHQALLNLCVNARDAMGAEYGGTGAGELTIETSVQPGAVLRQSHATAGADEYVCIKVSDTGVGMDEATRTRIFEPFFTTKGVGKGTGLGLAVVYGVVNSHHGFVEVESEPGKGTSFTMYLPVQARKLITAPEPPPPEEPAVTGGRKKILVVEDEEMLCELLKSFLEEQGYDVIAAHDGMEALEMFKADAEGIDLVLSDMGLPRLGGWEMFQRMRELKPRVRAILASGYFDPNLKMDLLKAGAMDFIQKPYNTDYILRRIRELLSPQVAQPS